MKKVIVDAVLVIVVFVSNWPFAKAIRIQGTVYDCTASNFRVVIAATLTALGSYGFQRRSFFFRYFCETHKLAGYFLDYPAFIAIFY